ncbi:MAG: hypothetical protein RBR86_06855 [Pseudobdellovibrionaceae bacterium]|jgi:ATP-dependent Clp protease ATP-binding subunit ClpA|nr:hypothetical protein [Pseudobdellovibrionaceae bacterium]
MTAMPHMDTVRGCMDALFRFDELERESMIQISEIFLEKSRREFEKKRGTKFIFNKAVVEAIADNGFDPAENARSVEKYIADNVLSVLTMPILRREIDRGDIIRLTYNKESGYGWDKLGHRENISYPLATFLPMPFPPSQGAPPG